MDSGNSGSLQSSSGGDEEYDSRAADSIFMSTHSAPHVGPISNRPPPPRPPPPLFDPLSNYMQLHQNPNSLLLNPNIAWSRPASIRSDPNSSTSHDTINPMLSTTSPPFIPSFQTPTMAALGEDNNHLGVATAAQNPNLATARNPRKRSRASRRAPTTVLTTDTTNFRAMVQEFTGIPAPPFNNSSFPRSRLDLFGTRSTALDAAQPPPPYLRRPFAQKAQSPPPFLVSSTSLSSSLLSSTANNNISSVSSTSSAASTSTTPINYQLPNTQSSNLFNVQNPLLTSLLQSNPKFFFSNSSVMASKPHHHGSFEIPSNAIKIGGLDEFGLGHGNHVSTTLSGLPNLISSDQIAAQNDRDDITNDNNAESWRNNGVRSDEGGDYQAQIKPVNGGYSFPMNTTNGKMNYSASSSNFHGEKGPENIATRGEGMVESWICSSE